MPDFAIVDAHVHLYEPGRFTYPWMASVPTLDRPHLSADYARATTGIDIEALVFVEVDAAAGEHLAEARFAQEQSRVEPRIRGLVASMPLEKGPAVEPDLVAYRELPLARGVRRLIQTHWQEPGWSLREEFIAGVKLLRKFDFTFDLCLYHTQLAEVTDLARRCPEINFVVDHIAKPNIREGIREPWGQELRALARLPNVWCKISGAVTEADHARWTETEVAPYVAHAIECFGFERVMFGSDWPVSELASSYRRWVDLVDDVVKDASEAERRRLYRDNAIAFYRL